MTSQELEHAFDDWFITVKTSFWINDATKFIMYRAFIHGYKLAKKHPD